MYVQMWQHYSEDCQPGSLELQAAQKAMRDTVAPKNVSLMLVAGSPTVRLIHEKQGRERAMQFVSHLLQTACLESSQQLQRVRQKKGRGFEIGE
jgi:hypothetical protein